MSAVKQSSNPILIVFVEKSKRVGSITALSSSIVVSEKSIDQVMKPPRPRSSEERTMGRRKEHGKLATRLDKLPEQYHAMWESSAIYVALTTSKSAESSFRHSLRVYLFGENW